MALRSASTILTSADNSVTYSAGYYDEFTVSTDITDIGGEVTYYHHVHSLTSTDEAIANSSPNLTTEGLDDNYMAEVPSGCYTTPIYYVKRTSSTLCSGSGAEPIFSGTTAQGGERNRCATCGYYWSCKYGSEEKNPMHYITTTTNEWVTSTEPDDQIEKTAYSLSCGYTKGAIAKIEITY